MTIALAADSRDKQLARKMAPGPLTAEAGAECEGCNTSTSTRIHDGGVHAQYA